MHLSVAVSKIDKWAERQGGDTLEMIERPHGGLSLVLSDGQSSGPGAKSISIWVVRKVVSELAEGVRDGAAARAANDILYAMRGGRVSATLAIFSVDLQSRSLVITRCGNASVYVRPPGSDLYALDEDSPPLGFYARTRPLVVELPLEPGLMACAFTDGLLHAGGRSGSGALDIPQAIESIWQETPSAQSLVDGLLARSLERDQNRPTDDTSVLAVHLQSGEPTGPRTLHAEMPLPDF